MGENPHVNIILGELPHFLFTSASTDAIQILPALPLADSKKPAGEGGMGGAKLVDLPREPTEEMVEAGAEVLRAADAMHWPRCESCGEWVSTSPYGEGSGDERELLRILYIAMASAFRPIA